MQNLLQWAQNSVVGWLWCSHPQPSSPAPKSGAPSGHAACPPELFARPPAPYASPLLCAVIYCLPKYNKDCLWEFSDFLVKLCENVQVLSVGDSSIHVCCSEKPLVKAFLDLLASLSWWTAQPMNVCTHWTLFYLMINPFPTWKFVVQCFQTTCLLYMIVFLLFNLLNPEFLLGASMFLTFPPLPCRCEQHFCCVNTEVLAGGRSYCFEVPWNHVTPDNSSFSSCNIKLSFVLSVSSPSQSFLKHATEVRSLQFVVKGSRLKQLQTYMNSLNCYY